MLFAIGERLLNVGKAYSGLTDAEIDQLTAFFQEHTVEDFGRVRSVEPLIVLEVAFNNVMRSDRHDSGFALRFPRILRIREDKPVAEDRHVKPRRGDLRLAARQAKVRRHGTLVAVRMTVVVGVSLNWIDRNDAAVRDLAFSIFKLDRGVVDAEVVSQSGVDFRQYSRTFRRGNVRDRNVSSECVRLRPRLQTCRSWTSSTP